MGVSSCWQFEVNVTSLQLKNVNLLNDDQKRFYCFLYIHFLLDYITEFLSEHPVPLPQQEVDVSGPSYFSCVSDAGLIFTKYSRNIIGSTLCFTTHDKRKD